MKRSKLFSLYAMSGFYLLAGLNHFRRPQFYLPMIQDFLPYPLELIYISGAAEILLGLALLWPATRAVAAWGIVALLIAVFPANINMWWNHVLIEGSAVPPWVHYIRLPLQFVLIYWAWIFTRRNTH